MNTIFFWAPMAFFLASLVLIFARVNGWWLAAYAAGAVISTAYDFVHGRSLWWDLVLLVLLLANAAAALWQNRREAAREAAEDAS